MNSEQSLKERVLLTITLLTIVKIGNFIPIPFINQNFFLNTPQIINTNLYQNSIIEILNIFSGGNNKIFGLFSLGIFPYINASIIIQLLIVSISSLKQLKQEEGEFGKRKLVNYTRILTFFLAIIQSFGLTYSLKKNILNWSFISIFLIISILVGGSFILVWFSELITKNGIGNGSSLLICFNIVSHLPDQFKKFLILINKHNNIDYLKLIIILILFLFSIFSCVSLNETIIKIPIITARQFSFGKSSFIRQINSFLPLRINQTGVMPLVFASSIMIVLSYIWFIFKIQFFSVLNIEKIFQSKIGFWSEHLLFLGLYSGLIFFFTYFYSTLFFEPKEIAEELRKNSVVIPKITPGLETEKYLTKTLNKIASFNAIFLVGIIAIIQFFELLLNISNLNSFGFTSQIILVNVLIDIIKRINSFLY
ncbi:MAG: preprotein translocase subunit SecY [Alphaproteobacteria bacterium]|nr:preprotein translocase subunit SecY [Alphaproteobacteria bacterium]